MKDYQSVDYPEFFQGKDYEVIEIKEDSAVVRGYFGRDVIDGELNDEMEFSISDFEKDLKVGQILNFRELPIFDFFFE